MFALQRAFFFTLLLIVVILGSTRLIHHFQMSQMATATRFRSVEFEVFGNVQGVFFRKHTEKKANQLKLVGWVKNTPHNTVVGVIQGPHDSIETMRIWLSTKGSPKSRITKCEFKNNLSIASREFQSFTIIRK
ncbi:Acylphosphatase-1 [Trichoplax sp. H2]|nr:Acylphosphatase-1 [Trichoplax sp. H2]|eukprot:RDD42613.1 Acylphosphatase-1 [Trichoplax sp. H2]